VESIKKKTGVSIKKIKKHWKYISLLLQYISNEMVNVSILLLKW
jgi:hypothetical protein